MDGTLTFDRFNLGGLNLDSSFNKQINQSFETLNEYLSIQKHALF